MQAPTPQSKQKREPTNQQLNVFRLSLQTRVINPSLTVLYSFTKKQSGTGIFSNERLLLFNSQQCSLRYYSKAPKGLPFTDVAEIVQGKQKIMIKETDKFKFQAISDKISTIRVQWFIGGKKNQWILTMASSRLRSDWVDAVNQYVNQKPGQVSSLPSMLKQYSKKKLGQNQNGENFKRQQQPIANNEMIHNQNPLYDPNPSEKEIKYINNDPSSSGIQKNNEKGGNQNRSQIQQKQKPVSIKDSRVNESSYPYNQPSNYYNRKGTERPEIQKINTDDSGKNTNIEGKHKNEEAKFILDQNRVNNYNDNQPNKKEQFYDPVTEIQYLRNKNQKMFNLTNQLSGRKNQPQIDPVNPNEIAQPQSKNLNNSKNQRIDERPRSQIYKNQGAQNKQLRNTNHRQKQQKPNEPQSNYHNKNSSKNILPMKDQPRQNNQKSLNNKNSQQASFEKQQINRLNNSQQNGFNSRQNLQSESKFQNRIYSEASKSFTKKSFSSYTRKWNQEWCDADSGTQIYVYEQFVNHSKQLAQKIIDQLPFSRRNREFTPIQQSSPFFVYKYDGIILVLHYQTKNTNQEIGEKFNPDAPVIFAQETYEELKTEFENYNLIVSVTGNRGFLRVPLCCYIEYKGLIALCKAQIPPNFHQAQISDFEQPFEALEELIKVKFPKSQLTLHGHPSSKYAIINDLSMLIPKIPNGMTPSGYFCKQFLTNYQQTLCDRQTIMDAHHSILKVNLNEFLSKFETLESYIVDTNDLRRELNELGLSYCYLPEIFHQSSCSHLKKLITTQLVAQVCANILRSQMSHTYSVFPTSEFDQINTQIINNIILDGIHILVNEIFSYSLKAENIWKVVVSQANKRFRIVVSKEDMIAGYLLSSIIHKIGLQCQFKKSSFDKNQNFFVNENTVPRDTLIDFKVNITQYDSSSISPTLRQIKMILERQADIAGFETIVQKLQLSKYDFPTHINELHDPLILYLANFVPFDDYGKYEHLDLYRGVLKQPHSYHSVKISLLAAKWLIKRKNIEAANHIFEIKCEQNSFWLGEFNPAVSQFYDFFSLYYASVGNYDESVKLAKSSLVNSIKILNGNSLPTADKHYQLGNILFKIGKKQQALKEYIKTKAILSSHQQTGIPEYGTILLKMSLLYLNFGKMKDSVVNGLESLKIFDNNGGSEQDQIETFQILSRAYEITRKYNDMASISTLCAQKFNNTQNPKIFQKMIKIVLFPKLSTLSSHDSKSLQNVIFRLQQIESTANYFQAFSFLHKLARSDIIVMKKFLSLLQNISRLYQDTIRKDLFRKHRSFSHETKSQAEQMLVMTEAICVMIGYGFVLGSLKQPYYQ